MAVQAASGGLVIGPLAALVDVPADRLDDPGEEGGLEAAIPGGDDLMTAGGVETAEGPLLPLADGVLGLVAVALRPGGGQDGLHRDGQSPDAGDGVGHPPLLLRQFRRIVKVPEGAAAAPAADGTAGLDPPRPRLHHLLDDAVAVGGQHLDDTRRQPVPRGGVGNEHRHPLVPAHPAALAGHRLDLQGDQVVFLQHNADTSNKIAGDIIP